MEMVHFLCNIPRRVQEYNPITAPGCVGGVNLRHTPLVFSKHNVLTLGVICSTIELAYNPCELYLKSGHSSKVLIKLVITVTMFYIVTCWLALTLTLSIKLIIILHYYILC